MTIQMPATIAFKLVIHCPVHQPGYGDLGRRTVFNDYMPTGEVMDIGMTCIGTLHGVGLEFIADGKQHETVRASHGIRVVNDIPDLIQGCVLKIFLKKIIFIGPYPDILTIDKVGLVEFGKEFRRHLQRKDMEIIHPEITH